MSDFIPIYAVDFDGTLCESKWPGIGEPNLDLINHLIKRQKEGAKIILWTCRIDERLEESVQWCKKYGLTFDAVNDNIQEMIDLHGSNCRKVFATCYIDDKSIFKKRFNVPYHPDNSEIQSEYETFYPVGSKWIFSCEGNSFPVVIEEYSCGGEEMKIKSISKGDMFEHYSCRREFIWFMGKLKPFNPESEV